MTTLIPASRSPWLHTSRPDLIGLLHAALAVGALRFARQTALSWLAYYPGDLRIKFLYARALSQAGQVKQAAKTLTDLCQADPEMLEAWELLSRTLSDAYPERNSDPAIAFQTADCQAAIHSLGSDPEGSLPLLHWADGIRKARQLLRDGDAEAAEQLVHATLLVEPLPPLVAITHLQVAASLELPHRALHDLADLYHHRFPACLLPTLMLAEALMAGGDSDRAVALLHQVATQDVSGQVPTRLWGERHPYHDLWPECLEAPLEIPIPADVAAHLGWNCLPAPRTPVVTIGQEAILPYPLDTIVHTQPTDLTRTLLATQPVIHGISPGTDLPPSSPGSSAMPESLLSVQSELERIAGSLKHDHLAHADGRFPVYVIFTTRSGLEKQYGAQGIKAIDLEIKRLVEAIAAHPDWGAIWIYADDPDCMATLSLSPAQPDDPWALKLALADLDATLARQGAMIGALLILGGPEVVPFHHLPNPVDDADVDVPSDNPYATRDENYFIPEWPVGRLPGGAQPDPQLLIQALRQMTERHIALRGHLAWYQRLWARLRARFRPSSRSARASWGYTAAIWRRASLSVFRAIGDPQAMLVSPPVQAAGETGNSQETFPVARLGYFNLHGLEDASEWYGQRDPSESPALVDYPIALRPQDIVNSGRAPQVVFSEACYGAHILDKNVEGALALKFLASGSRAVVGSTCTSYGSITTPLIAADLLGHAFWKYLREGFPAGEALRRAKIHLAQEMHRRQGYLDGEDQKTLISFILYGDPLAIASDIHQRSKTVQRPLAPPTTVRTVCDHASTPVLTGQVPATTLAAHSLQDAPPIPADTLARVKRVVEKYLPGMLDAQLVYAHSHAGCSGDGHTCPISTLDVKSSPEFIPERSVVTLSKHVVLPAAGPSAAQPPADGQPHPERVHRHYARLTLDSQGKIVKLSVSR